MSFVKYRFSKGHMMVSNDRSFWKWREVGTTVIIYPYIPIILCALLADTDLQLEEKWRMPQSIDSF